MNDRDTTHEKSAGPAEPEAAAENGLLRTALDFGPLLVFFASYHLGEDILALGAVQEMLGPLAETRALSGESRALFFATAVLMLVFPITLVISRIALGHVPRMALVTALIVAVSGGLTLWLQDETFIKMKLTIVNGLFALVLGIGLMQGRSYIQYLLGRALPLDDAGWIIFTQRWCAFFAFMAILNEVVWRTQTTEFWVNFRSFAPTAITLVFMVCQVPLLKRHMIEDETGPF